jgi:uncharacterized membrane protein
MDSRMPEEKSSLPIWMVFFRERFPHDLTVISLWIILTILGIYLPVLNTSPLRVMFALPMVLFIPGYALIASLFPGKEEIDGIERVALSFGLSIAVVPLIGLGLNYTPWGIRLDPIVISLVIFTFVMMVIAHFRRAILHPEERFVVPFGMVPDWIREEFFPAEGSRIDRILSIILLIAIIVSVGITIFAIAVPKEGEKFTEFYILGENKIAADYPDQIFVGNEYPMYIGVGNHEYRNITYTVETWLVQMDFNEKANISTISLMDPLDRFSLLVPDNETEITPYALSAPSTGYDRVEFLLFNESVPGSSVKGMDRINASYRDLHLWVNVRDRPNF